MPLPTRTRTPFFSAVDGARVDPGLGVHGGHGRVELWGGNVGDLLQRRPAVRVHHRGMYLRFFPRGPVDVYALLQVFGFSASCTLLLPMSRHISRICLWICD